MEKRGQVTIFVIIGIVLVAGVILVILYFSSRAPSLSKTSASNPESFLSSCLQSKTIEILNSTALNGGNGAISLKFLFNGQTSPTPVSYLCYTELDNTATGIQKCTNLYVLFPYFEKSLKANLNSDVKDCYESLISNLKNQYTVSDNYKGFNVSVQPKKVIININADITTTKGSGSSTQSYKNFRVQVPSSMYSLLQTVNDIENIIVLSCGFNSKYMTSIPNYDINWYNTINQSTVYSVKDRETNDQFNFAIRTCVMPAI